MDESNKNCLPRQYRLRRIARHVRERFGRQGRIVYRQILHGAAYSLGSGSVSLLILWFEARH